MASCLCITIRFLHPFCHARRSGDHLEWPPSPLRLFQALVSASAARWNERSKLKHALPALRWLEKQQPPNIVAPAGEAAARSYRLYVPDNVGDRVAASWSKGGNASIADYRVEKDIRSTHLRGEAVHFLYKISESNQEFALHRETLFKAVRNITHLGWGIDTVIGNAEVLSEEQVLTLEGQLWHPAGSDLRDTLRTPKEGTSSALIDRHEAFLNRIVPDGVRLVPALATFGITGYRCSGSAMRQSFAAFQILRTNASGLRAFDTVRRGLTVVGMTRYAAKVAAEHSGKMWTSDKINAFILGHGVCGESTHSEKHHPVGPRRFAFLPLPSVESRGASKARVIGYVRRMMLTCFAEECEDEIAWARRMLSGQELIDEKSKEAVALLSVIPATDDVVRCYAGRADTWATVTPVVLPGYDDPDHLRRRLKAGTSSTEQKRKSLERLSGRIEDLLRKAIVHAGFPQELADHAEIEWRKVGFWPGTDLADRYGVPDHLRRFPRFHVKVRWRNKYNQPIDVPGPICLGGGRFYGLGLLARL